MFSMEPIGYVRSLYTDTKTFRKDSARGTKPKEICRYGRSSRPALLISKAFLT